MRRETLISYYANGVSHGALISRLYVVANPYQSMEAEPNHQAAIGLLERVRLWLQLIFGEIYGKNMMARLTTQPYESKPNRYYARKRRHKMPLARQADSLGYHILRRRGYAACLEWIYNRTLTTRIVWCFKDWGWRDMPRICFAVCTDESQKPPHCAKPLSPD